MALSHIRGPDVNAPEYFGIVGTFSSLDEVKDAYPDDTDGVGLLLAEDEDQLNQLLIAWPASVPPPFVGWPSITLEQIETAYSAVPDGRAGFLVARNVREILWLVDSWRRELGR
jgi:hypothetical protein